ncbi:hypothetical protein DICPUDRAFT_81797 [Dictyostelium purpureum]|uniref:Uncharacterized protein n=1 Tax=Dictyostelium purpureum TaxID=5786 RepID=F0ZUL6_DICPU|nr:uncharacterized protein DICPUDRAFT_81797 [Dictyostelium purpureum]EGC32381.1 hypothetical protein DICPUDRAFT_81797 [Dictyostelium purpureum]|eukprot:XP_003291111.1 hypothetical protein DICPUDRAFT_81797 [Dictyostelium purpureum]
MFRFCSILLKTPKRIPNTQLRNNTKTIKNFIKEREFKLNIKETIKKNTTQKLKDVERIEILRNIDLKQWTDLKLEQKVYDFQILLNAFPHNYRSHVFYNYWLYKLSSNDSQINYETTWRLVEHMVENNIELYNKSISKFIFSVFKSSTPLSPERIQILHDLELEGEFYKTILKTKLKFFPTNDFTQYKDNNQTRSSVLRGLQKLKKQNLFIHSKEIIKLYVQLAKIAYPIEGDIKPKVLVENFTMWKVVLFKLRSQLPYFINVAALELGKQKRKNARDLFKEFLKENELIILENHLSTVLEIIQLLTPIEKAEILQKYKLRPTSQFSPELVDIIKKIKEEIPEPSKYTKLDEIISRENKLHNQEYQEVLKLIEEYYLRK